MQPKKYGPRKGLDGPYDYSGRILYWDPVEKQYWDPTTDFYIELDEMFEISGLCGSKNA